MRTYGTIGEIDFNKIGFSIFSLGFEYELRCDGEVKTVSVNKMSELKKEIAGFQREIYEENKI